MKEKNAPSTTSDLARAPEGFRRMGSVTAECWFSLETDNTIRGKLLGCYKRKDPRNKVTGESEFFQVELTQPARCRYGKGEKATVKMAAVGVIVNMNCNTKTLVLKDLIADINRGAEYEIYVHCGKKMELANGNTMWNMTPSYKMLVAPKASDDVDFGGGDGEGGADEAAQGAA